LDLVNLQGEIMNAFVQKMSAFQSTTRVRNDTVGKNLI